MNGGRLSRRQFFGQAAAAPLAAPAAGREQVPSKGWIILAVDWEYNDEFNWPTDGTHPLPKVYLDEQAAEAECRRLCDEFFTQLWRRPQEFEPQWDMYSACDPDTATWDDLREDGFPDPYFVKEVEL